MKKPISRKCRKCNWLMMGLHGFIYCTLGFAGPDEGCLVEEEPDGKLDYSKIQGLEEVTPWRAQ